MDWEENAQLPTGNEIRALPDQPSLSYDSFGLASEILPGGQDDIGTVCRRYPLLRSGRKNGAQRKSLRSGKAFT